MINFWLLVLAAVGAITSLRAVYSVLDFLALHFLKPSHPLSRYKRPSPGPTYALITGASAGIGLGVARALVKQGFGVILLGHLSDELDAASEELRRLRPDAAVRKIV